MNNIHQAALLTAIKTPYKINGNIDLDAYKVLVQRQIAAGVDGLIVGGTTGEGNLLDWDEHIMLIAYTVQKFGNSVIVVGNTGSNNTKEAFHATEQGFAVGMHASLQINPYYGKTSNAGLIKHFSKLLGLGPTIVYNVPARTAQDIEPVVIKQLAEHPNFLGVKECAGNERIAQYEQQGIACWSADDATCWQARHQHQSHGVISVASNIVPFCMRQLMDEEDLELNEKLQPLFAWLFAHPNPIPLNSILPCLGLVQPVFRLPYVPLTQAELQRGMELLAHFNAKEELPNMQLLGEEQFTLI